MKKTNKKDIVFLSLLIISALLYLFGIMLNQGLILNDMDILTKDFLSSGSNLLSGILFLIGLVGLVEVRKEKRNKNTEDTIPKKTNSLKKYISLIGYLIFFLLSGFMVTATISGLQQGVYIGSVVFLLILSLIFIGITILLYKIYRKNK